MDDSKLLALFWNRDENAICEVDVKYGSYCRKIAMNILTSPEDAEECVSDTWLKAWESIPPEMPKKLKAWLGKVVRNTALTNAETSIIRIESVWKNHYLNDDKQLLL